MPPPVAVVGYSTVWVPQIARSVLRGRNAALTTEYLVGTTACRLLFVFCLYPDLHACLLGLIRIRSDCMHYSENIFDLLPSRGFYLVFTCFWLSNDHIFCCSLGLDRRGVDGIPGLRYSVTGSLRARVLLACQSKDLFMSCSSSADGPIPSSQQPRHTIITPRCDFPMPNPRTAPWETARSAWMRSSLTLLRGKRGDRPRKKRLRVGLEQSKDIGVGSSMSCIGMWSVRQT